MPKRKYGGGSSSKKKSRKSTSKLDKAYKKVVRKKVTAKKKRVVRKAKSKALDAMAMLRHPATALVKFRTSMCNTYMMGQQFIAAQAGNPNFGNDTNMAFPVDGLKIRLNDIYNPYGVTPTGITASFTGNLPTGAHASGFDNISRQYGKYRVVGSKLTIKFRRMGGTIPHQTTHPVTIVAPMTGTSGAGTSAAANLGTIFDPSNMDPLLCMIIDRSAWQDANSQITESSIDEYKDVMRYKGMKGLKWRELKAGAGQSTTIVHKWSEKRFAGGAGHNTDRKQANTGLFHPEQAGTFIDGGSSPTTPDELVFKIKQFDKKSPYHAQFKNARIMVTVDMEYVVKCFESKYSYQQGSGLPT